MVLANKRLVTRASKTEELYAAAGSIANEALTLIRTVISFGTRAREVER